MCSCIFYSMRTEPFQINWKQWKYQLFLSPLLSKRHFSHFPCRSLRQNCKSENLFDTRAAHCVVYAKRYREIENNVTVLAQSFEMKEMKNMKKNRCETWKALNIRIVGDTFYVISIICANYECTHTHVRNGIDLRVYWKHVMYVRSERRTPGAKLSHIYSIYTEWPGITSIKKVDMKKNGERKNGQPFLYKIHNIFSFSIISFLVPFLNCIYNFFSIGKHSLFLFCTYTVMYINIKMHTHVLIDQWFLVMLLLLLSLHIGCIHAAGWKKILNNFVPINMRCPRFLCAPLVNARSLFH